MELADDYQDIVDEIVAMFLETFTASEGLEAGGLIKRIVSDIFRLLTPEDMYVFSVVENGEVLASIILARITYPNDHRTVFILAPVAVSTIKQGQDLGQRLINHGLQELRQNGVDVALTYGDHDFYSKIGFVQITEADAQPPLPPRYPEGWLGQSLIAIGRAC